MKRLLFILIICLYANAYAENKELGFESCIPRESGYLCSENAYLFTDQLYQALRLSRNDGPLFDLELKCKVANRSFRFSPDHGNYNDNYKFKENVKKLKEGGMPSNILFPIYFYEYNIKGQGVSASKKIIEDIGILHIDSPSSLHFTFPYSNSAVINIELTNPKAKPITLAKLPKNAIVEYDEAMEIFIPDYVRLWENNATDQKMICGVYFYNI
jgi:hypothetical protein